MLDKQISVSTMSSQVARWVGLRIVSGEFQPGDTLPIEFELGEAYGVSRSTVREAIKNLASKGLIEVSPKVGTRVLPVARWNMFDGDILSWRFYAKCDAQMVHDIFELRCCLESRAAYLSAQKGAEADIDRVRRAVEQLLTMDRTDRNLTPVVAEFHLAVLDGSGNNFLSATGMAVKTSIKVMAALAAKLSRNIHAESERYVQVHEAIANRDSALASARMCDLLEENRRYAIAAVETMAAAAA